MPHFKVLFNFKDFSVSRLCLFGLRLARLNVSGSGFLKQKRLDESF